MVQVNKISQSFADRNIYRNVSLTINKTSKAAVCGANGSGKSSLLKVISGVNQADEGEVLINNSTRLVYLAQSSYINSDNKLYKEAETAFDYWKEQQEEIFKLGEEISRSKDEKEQEKLLKRQHQLQEDLNKSPYYAREKMIYEVLSGLGFKIEDMEKDASSFSGGWQMRIALARCLLSAPDIMLLDEPTNYLDIEARQWLESFLKRFKGAYLLVSHDRYFLDNCVDTVYELFQGELHTYKGNYSYYLNQREERRNTLLAKITKQNEERKKAQEFIDRFRYKASKAAQVQSRIKMLEKMEDLQGPQNNKSIKLQFPDPPHCGKQLYILEELEKYYGNYEVFSGINMTISKGCRMAVCGVNGAGKSTLLRILAKRDDHYSGNIQFGSGLDIGYFSQDFEKELSPELNVLEEAEKDAPLEMQPKVRSLLGSFLFQDDDVFKKVAVLSGGEKNRLALIKILMQPHNLLIFDEPTNHLDIQSKEVLLEALRDFKGSIIFVSHDRYFLEELSTSVLYLLKGSARYYPGDYSYFLYRKNEEEENKTSYTENDNDKLSLKPCLQENNAESQQKLDYQRSKEQRNRLKKLQREEEKILEEIEEIEIKKESLHKELSLQENYSDPLKSAQLQKKIEELEKKEESKHQQWENISQELHEN